MGFRLAPGKLLGTLWNLTVEEAAPLSIGTVEFKTTAMCQSLGI